MEVTRRHGNSQTLNERVNDDDVSVVVGNCRDFDQCRFNHQNAVFEAERLCAGVWLAERVGLRASQRRRRHDRNPTEVCEKRQMVQLYSLARFDSLEYWVCSLVNVTKITEDDAVARCGSPKNVSTLPVGVNSVKVSDNVVNVVGQVLLPSAVVKVGAINLSWDQTVRECCSKDDRVCDPSIVKLNRVSKTFTYQAAVLGQDCSHSTSEKPVTMVLMYRTAEKTSTAAAPTTAASSAASTVAVPNDCICDRCCPPAAQCKTGCRNPKEPDLCSMFQSSSAAIASLGGWLTTLTLLASVQL